ncbi:hypothetical protein [Streptomyces sp. NPDC088360]|uniref:hypothetical protein n=1 Tax=unclassified Streptomyces TaxID=2593676 RepID=UPI00344CC86B
MHFGRPIKPERPRVEFGDGVAESEQSTATTPDLLARAGDVSTGTKGRWLHPDWDDTAVQAEAAAILTETGAGAPDWWAEHGRLTQAEFIEQVTGKP